MQRVWLAVLLLGLGAIGAAVAAAASQPARVSAIAAAPQPSPTATPDPGGANGQAFKDGCTRDPSSLIDGLAPEWAYVYNTPPDQPPPPPRWVVGTVSAYNKAFVPVHISGGDLPSGHDAYDYNVNIAPDSPYTYLVGGHPATVTSPATGNYPGNDESTARLHTEWEDDAIPKFAWAQDGDRLTELGNWVWDCGHWGTPTQIFSPDYVLPKVGQPCLGTLVEIDSVFDPAQCTISGESTEFHPYRALWDVRAQPNSPEGESEAELFVSTHATRAGIIAGCAHKNPPVNALPNTALRACVQTDPDWQDVSGDYSFFLAAPPPPSATAHLIYRAIDRGSTGGAPAPTLTAKGNGVQVDFHLATTPGQQQQLAYQVFAGWDQLAAAAVPTHLHVTFERLTVHRAMDPGCSLTAPVAGCQDESLRANQLTTPPGEWNIVIDAQGQWLEWGNGEFDPNDGTVLAGDKALDLYIPPGKGWTLYAGGRECDLGAIFISTGYGPARDCPGLNPGANAEPADDNDVPGMIFDTFSSAAASVGTHHSNARTHKGDPTSTCPDTNVAGCYSLDYTVSLVDDAATRVLAPPSPPPLLPNTQQRSILGLPPGATLLVFIVVALFAAGGLILVLASRANLRI